MAQNEESIYDAERGEYVLSSTNFGITLRMFEAGSYVSKKTGKVVDYPAGIEIIQADRFGTNKIQLTGIQNELLKKYQANGQMNKFSKDKCGVEISEAQKEFTF